MGGIHELLKAILFVGILIWLVYGLLVWQERTRRKSRATKQAFQLEWGNHGRQYPNESVMNPVPQKLAFLADAYSSVATHQLPNKRHEITYFHECPVCGKGHRVDQARHAMAYCRQLTCSTECESQRREK